MLLILPTLLLFACKNDEFSMQKEPYTGTHFRIDGYYYLDYGNPATRIINFFYRDGTMLSVGAVYVSDLDSVENSYRNGEWYRIYSEHILRWGIFTVNGSVIKHEKWYHSSGGGWPAYVSEGVILNDTTYKINSIYRPLTGERLADNAVYHFKQFSPKPDSTNTYIK